MMVRYFKGVLMSFFTLVNCIDGRVQLPALKYIQDRYNVEYIDSITEPGPVRFLADDPKSATTASILTKVDLSLDVHLSNGIAIVAHHDCAGNPVSMEKQLDQLFRAKKLLKDRYSDINVISLWIGDDWKVVNI